MYPFCYDVVLKRRLYKSEKVMLASEMIGCSCLPSFCGQCYALGRLRYWQRLRASWSPLQTLGATGCKMPPRHHHDISEMVLDNVNGHPT